MCVIDLTLILVNDSVCFVRLFGLLISRLGQDHNLDVLCAITSSLLMHVFLIVLAACRLANYYTSRVTSVRKVDRLAFLVNTNDCAATETAVKTRLLLHLGLNL